MSIDVEGKSLVDLLDMLEPAPVPDPISMVPQTWGWVVLAVVLAGLIAFGTYAVIRNRRMNAYRREALAELSESGNDTARVAEILRRTALVAFPRRQVAALHGVEWTNFLQQTSGKVTFSTEASRKLAEAPYRNSTVDPDLARLARDWITTHKRERTT